MLHRVHGVLAGIGLVGGATRGTGGEVAIPDIADHGTDSDDQRVVCGETGTQDGGAGVDVDPDRVHGNVDWKSGSVTRWSECKEVGGSLCVAPSL